MSTSVQLEVSLVSASVGAVAIRYRARNNWNRDVYLFNRLFETAPDGKRTLDPNRVYVQVEGSILKLSKQLFDVPEDVEVESPEVPYLTRVAPGQAYEEEIRLALPVRESYPYSSSRAARAPGEKRFCEQLVFTLGYFSAREARWVRPATLDGQEVLATDYGFAIQSRESVGALPLRVRTECIAVADPRRRTRG
jgi:hypothetical protein